MSHDFGCHGNHFGMKLCVIYYQNMEIIKLAGAGWIQGVHDYAKEHWKAAVFSIDVVCEELWYIVDSDTYGQFNCKYLNN